MSPSPAISDTRKAGPRWSSSIRAAKTAGSAIWKHCTNSEEHTKMSLREFRKAGHTPTLAAAFLYFDVSFMVWVILGPLGPFIGESLKLSATQKGFLTAVPLLGGSFFRVILGLMTERIGG